MKKDKICRLVKAHLVDIAEKKEIPALPGEIFRSHLESCPQCSRVVNEFSLLWNRIEAPKEIEPSPHFWGRLMNKIETQEQHEASPGTILTGLKSFLRAFPVTALILIGIISGNQLGRTPHKITQDKTYEFVNEYFDKLEEIPPESLAEAYLYLTTDTEVEEDQQ